jgi:hypothetical protein
MDEQEGPVDVTVRYEDGTVEVHRRVTGGRVLELEELAFTDPNVVSTETKPSAPRPHAKCLTFHNDLDDLVEQVRLAAHPDSLAEPLTALGLAAYARERMADLFGDLVGAARLGGASWEAIGRELGLSKQTAFNQFRAFDPTRWDGTSPRCQAAEQLPGDTDPCEGDMEAVKIFESSRPIPEQAKAPGGTLACVRHGAKLYARIHPSRSLVYPVGGPNRPGQCAITVYKRAQEIRKGAAA